MPDSRILLIEDDRKISETVARGLTDAGFEVDVVYDGDAALVKARRNKYDLLLLDLMLPKRDGLSVLRELRAQGDNSKVLILSAKHNPADRVVGLNIGADDYLTKPFLFAELEARCKALLRRGTPSRVQNETHLEAGPFRIDLVSRVAFLDGNRIDLRPKEFMLLELCMRRPGEILTKNQILEQIWRYNFDPQTNVVDVLVCRLRTKIQGDSARKTLRTIRGRGYVFEPI